jgi:hypothetical protein
VRARHVIAVLTGCVIGGLIAAVVFAAKPSPAPPPAPKQRTAKELAAQAAASRQERAVASELSTMHRAAVRGDRAALAQSQRTLERLAQTDPRPARTSTETDPFARALEAFAFKRAPLFVQQIRSTDASHRMTAGVDRAAFCLLTPGARQAAVRGAYEPLVRRLRGDGIRDLKFVVVALTQREPTAKQELAIAERGTVKLTARGRAC